MLTFLIFGALAIAVFGVAAIPFMLIGLLFKLIVLPFRLFFFLLGGAFRLVFGLLGGLLGLIVGPIMLLIVGVALLGLLVWAIYRVVRRPTPAF